VCVGERQHRRRSALIDKRVLTPVEHLPDLRYGALPWSQVSVCLCLDRRAPADPEERVELLSGDQQKRARNRCSQNIRVGENQMGHGSEVVR
jgi:hypothetical protein